MFDNLNNQILFKYFELVSFWLQLLNTVMELKFTVVGLNHDTKKKVLLLKHRAV